MAYEKIMNVGFAIKDEKKGCIIIGGIDDDFSLDRLDIEEKNIIVKNSINEFVFEVKKVDISTSISGKINIGLRLIDSADFSKIVAGDEVFKII
ncbi:hypothetical protein [Clostridium felsineum]|uniref:hypothetical protein n=1 Tax=Clostridium felsineum TaxID=36839 RepID=UPI00098BD789|nr:hypothetical protein [Clostridium felsineum]URZ03828.1 hypothetical protein CLAUR_038930 [Clostridium felsineum]